LAGFGAGANSAVPALLKAKNDTSPFVRDIATEALMLIPAYAVSNLTAVAAAPGDRQTRREAISAIGRFRQDAGEAVPVLVKCLQDEDVAAYAALALGQIKRDPDIVIPVLLKNLQSTNVGIRNCAVHALGDFGPKARSTEPELSRLLDDPAAKVRTSAA